MSLAPYRRIDDGRAPGIARMRIHGATVAALFEHAGAAMWSLGYHVASVPPTYSRPIVAPGDTVRQLLRNWLEELLWVADVEQFVWSWFVVDRLEEGGVQGSASGMPRAGLSPISRPASGVDSVRADPISVPEGWWVDVDFLLGAG